MSVTPVRTVRVPDELWAAVEEIAAQRGLSTSALVNLWLTQSVNRTNNRKTHP